MTTPPAEWWQKKAEAALGGLKQQGLASPTWGVTRPLPAVTDAKSYLAALDTAMNERRARIGGGLMNPNYSEERFKFLSAEEGVRNVAYDDHKGNRSVGIGFNMARPDARDVWAKAGVRADFDAVYNKKATLAQDEVKRLFDVTVQEAEAHIDRMVGKVPLSDNQRIALVSMAFNSPALIGPNTSAAVKSGDVRAVVARMLYKSNKYRDKLLAPRRYREAALFAGADAKSLLPDFQSYKRSFI